MTDVKGGGLNEADRALMEANGWVPDDAVPELVSGIVRMLAAAREEARRPLVECLQWFIDDIDGTHTVMVEFDANVAKARAALSSQTGSVAQRSTGTGPASRLRDARRALEILVVTYAMEDAERARRLEAPILAALADQSSPYLRVGGELREQIAAAIEETDRRVAYGMELIRLVDGDHTYRLQIDGETLLFTDSETPEWNAQQRLYAHIAAVKSRVRADAILALLAAAPQGGSARDQPCADVQGRSPQVFLDCDGVLADFDEAGRILWGEEPRAHEARVGSKQFWRELEDRGDFYRTLPLMADAMALYEGVKHLNPIILTGCPRGGWAEAQKVDWAARHFPGVQIITCRSADKRDHAKTGDVLIDDYAQHRHRWIEMGGVFITHHDAASSLAALWAHYPALRDGAASRPTGQLRDKLNPTEAA